MPSRSVRCQLGTQTRSHATCVEGGTDPKTAQVDWNHLTDLSISGLGRSKLLPLASRARRLRSLALALALAHLTTSTRSFRASVAASCFHSALPSSPPPLAGARFGARPPGSQHLFGPHLSCVADDHPHQPVSGCRDRRGSGHRVRVAQAADPIADRAALIDGPSGRIYTFAELNDLIHRFAGGLAALGFGPGDTLALMAPNIPEYAIVFHGVAVAGGTVTTINPTYGAEEVRFQLLDAGATMLVTIGLFAEVAKAAIEGTPIPEVLTLDGAEGTGNALALLGDPIEQVPVDAAERRRRAALLVGHHRPAQGRDAHAPQPGRQHVPDRAAAQDRRRRGLPGVPAVLPHLRHAGADEPAACRSGGTDRDDAAVRPAAVAGADPAAQGAPGSSPCRRWCWRSPSTRSSTSTTCRA